MASCWFLLYFHHARAELDGAGAVSFQFWQKIDDDAKEI